MVVLISLSIFCISAIREYGSMEVWKANKQQMSVISKLDHVEILYQHILNHLTGAGKFNVFVFDNGEMKEGNKRIENVNDLERLKIKANLEQIPAGYTSIGDTLSFKKTRNRVRDKNNSQKC